MSGGTFQFNQYKISEIADDLEEIIYNNDGEYSRGTIEEFKIAVRYLKLAAIYAHRIDYLIACDDGEETFHERLGEELHEFYTGGEII